MVVPAASRDDETLAARAADGDRVAFEELVLRYRDRVYRLACRLTRDPNDAADILQESFLLAFRGLRRFRGESSFSTWLYRIATNAALTHNRSRSRRPSESLESFLPAFDDLGRHRATPEQLAVACGIEERLDRETLASRAREALDRLPESCRVAFVLRDLEELPTAEVAQLLSLRPDAVRQRVHRARLLLRGYLTDLAGGKK